MRDTLPRFLHLTLRLRLEPVAFSFPLSRRNSLLLELLQLLIQDAIALLSFGFRFFVQACIAQRSFAGTLSCSRSPLLDVVEPLLQCGSLFADLGIGNRGLAIAMVGIQSQRQKIIADPVFLQRPAADVGKRDPRLSFAS